MTLDELFVKADTMTEYKHRAASKRIRKNKSMVTNPEVLSPEAYKHFAKETAGVPQVVSVQLTRANTFVYISHSKFK